MKNASTKQEGEGRREGKSKAGRGYDVKDAGISLGGEERGTVIEQLFKASTSFLPSHKSITPPQTMITMTIICSISLPTFFPKFTF